MRLAILLTAVSAAALGTAACAPRVDYAHKTSLDCPDRQGELQRTGVAPDRRSCTYAAGSGTEVTLQLTPANTDANTALTAIEASLTGPAAAGAAPAKTEAAAAAPKPPTPPPPAKPIAASSDADRAAQEASQDARGTGADSAKDNDWNTGRHHHGLTINGRHVVDDDDGEVDLPGVHVSSRGDHANVDVMGIHVDANGDDATVHVMREVRLAGHAFSRERDGVRATFVAKRDNLPDGYRVVGYQAAGPKSGPITVAVVKSRDDISQGDRLYRDIRRLVRRNGGA